MGLFSKKKNNTQLCVEHYFSVKEAKKLEQTLFSEQSDLSIHQKELLLLAAPMLAKDNEKVDIFPVYNSFKTAKLKAQFESTWGELTEENVVLTVNEMLENETSKDYNKIYEYLSQNANEKEWQEELSKFEGISSLLATNFLSIKTLFKHINDYKLNMPKASVAAYDIVRAANLVVVAEGLQIISMEKAVEMLEICYSKAKDSSADYSEFYSGYLIGRAFWLIFNNKYMAVSGTRDLNICYTILNSDKSVLKNQL